MNSDLAVMKSKDRLAVRIYQAPVPEKFKPNKSPFRYPEYSRDWGVEQDFCKFIDSSDLLTNDSSEASHVFLPIYWTRYWLQNDYGKDGHSAINAYLNSLELDNSKIFTICQYDDGPLVDFVFGKGLYLASRKTPDLGRDIPLLASNLPRSGIRKKTKYLMSFAGRFETHPVRMNLKELSTHRGSVFIPDRQLNARGFASLLHQSLVVLCPRGYGGSSFRFYEAMQVGSVPCLIGDIDTRPFKSQIQWDQISFYFKTPLEAITFIETMDSRTLENMGKAARHTYYRFLKFGKWGNLLINDLCESSDFLI